MTGNELGAFLRARREAAASPATGRTGAVRRRTPGLRRAELAVLAGVSVDYLARLEQGRDRHPSAQVLAALADALELSADERFHLLLLSKQATGAALLCPTAQAPAQTVRATIRAVLDRLEPAPASVVNRLGDVLAHTTGYARLVGPVGLLDTERPNLVRFMFTDSRAAAAYANWDAIADRLVADLRLESCPSAAALIDELSVTGGGAFTDRMSAPPTVPERTRVDHLDHPEVGEVRLANELLELPDADSQRLIVYLPADDASASALDRLTARNAFAAAG